MRRTILVVDDEPPIAALLATVLQDEGYNARCAHDGEAALALIDRDPPDLVVSDVMMPKLDGASLAERLRARGDPTPVVLMSAASPRVVVSGVRFVPKPFDLDRIVAAVRDALAERPAMWVDGNEGGSPWSPPAPAGRSPSAARC